MKIGTFRKNTDEEEGVFGPEIRLNAHSGQACFWHDSGQSQGQLPPEPLTNAFLIWVGLPVLVVSAGVAPENRGAVARVLRECLGDSSLSILFPDGPVLRGVPTNVIHDGPAIDPVLLAKAEAYARVQLSWEEGDVAVNLEGATFLFEVQFRPKGNRFVPILTFKEGGT